MDIVIELQKRLYEILNQKKVYLDTAYDSVAGKNKHDYYLNGEKINKENGYYGVTTYIGDVLFVPFDREAAFMKVFNSPRYEGDPHYKYYKMNKQIMFQMWDDTAAEGTELHNAIDKFLHTYCKEDLKPTKFPYLLECLKVVFNECVPGTHIFASEIAVVDEELKISGCIDALFYNSNTNEFIIVDWKTNSISDVSYDGKNGVHAASKHLKDTKYSHYHCQVNMYALILERNYGIKCSKLFIVGFGYNKDDVRTSLSRNDMSELVKRIKNMDVYTVPCDDDFKTKFIRERKREVRYFNNERYCIISDKENK
jgi:hypothetical protein